MNLRTRFILRFNLYSLVINLLCTGTAVDGVDGVAGLIFVPALEAVEAGIESAAIFNMSRFMGISCAFSAVTS